MAGVHINLVRTTEKPGSLVPLSPAFSVSNGAVRGDSELNHLGSGKAESSGPDRSGTNRRPKIVWERVSEELRATPQVDSSKAVFPPLRVFAGQRVSSRSYIFPPSVPVLYASNENLCNKNLSAIVNLRRDKLFSYSFMDRSTSSPCKVL